MAHSLSNLSFSHPMVSQNTTSTCKTPQVSRFTTSNCLKNGKNMIKATINKDSLDHLQKNNKYQQPQQQQQQQIKKRAPQIKPIGLWDVFPATRTVQQMLDTMDRVMDDPSAYSSSNGGVWSRSESGNYSRGRTPWEIKEGEGDYKLRFDMPGMAKQDAKVWVEEKMLVVKAEKKTENGENDKEEDWPAKGFGKYSFRIALPENIEYEKIKAEVRDGVLYINIPKARVSSKVLDINVE